jgi:hypothetical protein
MLIRELLENHNSAATLSDVKAEWADMNIDFRMSEKDDIIELSKIIVPKSSRNLGIGTLALTALCAYADNSHKTIVLSPSNDYGGNVSKLKKLYKHFGLALKYVPDDLLTPELSKIAVTNNIDAVRYVPQKLRTYEMCDRAVKSSAYLFHLVPEDKQTPELCNLAVSNTYGYALQFVADELRTLELCKIAVSYNGHMLEHVPEKYRNTLLPIAKNTNNKLSEIRNIFITPISSISKELLLDASKYFSIICDRNNRNNRNDFSEHDDLFGMYAYTYIEHLFSPDEFTVDEDLYQNGLAVVNLMKPFLSSAVVDDLIMYINLAKTGGNYN